MAEITTLFSDIGGVILTNGWDRNSRKAACDAFNIDWLIIYQSVTLRKKPGMVDLCPSIRYVPCRRDSYMIVNLKYFLSNI